VILKWGARNLPPIVVKAWGGGGKFFRNPGPKKKKRKGGGSQFEREEGERKGVLLWLGKNERWREPPFFLVPPTLVGGGRENALGFDEAKPIHPPQRKKKGGGENSKGERVGIKGVHLVHHSKSRKAKLQ